MWIVFFCFVFFACRCGLLFCCFRMPINRFSWLKCVLFNNKQQTRLDVVDRCHFGWVTIQTHRANKFCLVNDIIIINSRYTTKKKQSATPHDDSSDPEFNTASDYTSVDPLTYTMAAEVWGKTVYGGGKLIKAANFSDSSLPENASTLMVKNGDGALERFLIGIYTPEFKDHAFYKEDIANMSCIVRIQLDCKNKTRSNSIAAVVFDFTVKLLEYECVSFTDGVEIASFAKASINTYNLSSIADQIYKGDIYGYMHFYSLSLNQFGASGSDCITQRQFLMTKQSVHELDNSSDNPSSSSTTRKRG